MSTTQVRCFILDRWADHWHRDENQSRHHQHQNESHVLEHGPFQKGLYPTSWSLIAWLVYYFHLFLRVIWKIYLRQPWLALLSIYSVHTLATFRDSYWKAFNHNDIIWAFFLIFDFYQKKKTCRTNNKLILQKVALTHQLQLYYIVVIFYFVPFSIYHSCPTTFSLVNFLSWVEHFELLQPWFL